MYTKINLEQGRIYRVIKHIAGANRSNYDEEDLRCECEQIYLIPHRKSYQLNSFKFQKLFFCDLTFREFAQSKILGN